MAYEGRCSTAGRVFGAFCCGSGERQDLMLVPSGRVYGIGKSTVWRQHYSPVIKIRSRRECGKGMLFSWKNGLLKFDDGI